MEKKTLVIGASTNPSRYAYKAVQRLIRQSVEVVPIGIREGTIEDIPIQQGQPTVNDIHTISLYLRPDLQKEYYDYIFQLQPKRLLFNPGTENAELMRLAKEAGIEV
ncbi:MAG: CoA-binding protein, partial [Bacteroidota bacterium]